MCAVKLFEMNSSLIWLKDNQTIPVNRPILLEIVTTFIAGVRLVERGPAYEVEFFSYRFPPDADTSKEPNDKVLTGLMEGLKLLVAKGPSAPQRLTPQQRAEVQTRLKSGEPHARIDAAYGIDSASIEWMARQTF